MLYNHKSEELIQDVILDSVKEIVDEIREEYARLRRNESIAVYCPIKLGKAIFNTISNTFEDAYVYSESDLDVLEGENPIIITLWHDGGVFVEDASFEGTVLLSEATMTYMHDSFKQKDVERVAGCEFPVLVFGFHEEETVVERPSISISINGVDMSDADEKEKILRDFLKSYCEEMDKYNEHLRRLVSIDTLFNNPLKAFFN